MEQVARRVLAVALRQAGGLRVDRAAPLGHERRVILEQAAVGVAARAMVMPSPHGGTDIAELPTASHELEGCRNGRPALLHMQR